MFRWCEWGIKLVCFKRGMTVLLHLAHSVCKKSERSRKDCAHFLLVNLATEYNVEFKKQTLN